MNKLDNEYEVEIEDSMDGIEYSHSNNHDLYEQI